MIERIAERLSSEVARLRELLVQCDIFLRAHAKPGNELKADVQAALRSEERHELETEKRGYHDPNQ